MAKVGMAARITRLDEGMAQSAARAWVAEEMSENPSLDAVIAPIDAMANGVVAGLKETGRAIPTDVKVLTRYNGIRAQTENPPLTAIDLNLEKAAELATVMLLDLIEGAALSGDRKTPPPKLIIRESTVPALPGG
jgi:DNA-binding LacI/PurR family transcriptional regulator